MITQMSLLVVGLLTIAAFLQSVAWYHHLNKGFTYVYALAYSMTFAFIEYIFLIEGNRLGHDVGWSVYDLRIASLVITIAIFVPYAYYFFGETLTWKKGLALALVAVAGYLAFS